VVCLLFVKVLAANMVGVADPGVLTGKPSLTGLSVPESIGSLPESGTASEECCMSTGEVTLDQKDPG
jgi:hypothetical protein